MRPVVSDTGPLHYLVLIGAIDCVPALFGRVFIPEAVAIELSHPATPSLVREWLETPPPWLESKPESAGADLPARMHGAGERAAIELATWLDAQLLLIDDRGGAAIARGRGLETIGTLGVLVRSAQLGLVDLRPALSRLRETNFRCRPELLDALLTRHGI